MDSSLTNFELSESTVKIGTDSESGSDKSDAMEIVGYADVESNGSNGDNKSTKENDLPNTATLLTSKETGAEVYLVGTAHFSKESQEDVRKVIRKVRPQIVVVELCHSRTNILKLDEETIMEEAKKVDMSKIIYSMKSSGAVNGIMYILLLNMSAYITKEIGMAPGGEFRVAYQEAEKIPNCSIHLGDRPIGITIRRALSKLTWFQTIKLAWHLLTNNEPVSVEEIERCKDRDMLEQLLAELAGEYPAFQQVFLNERDIFLTNVLQSMARKAPPLRPGEVPSDPLKIVGVVGMAHTTGIIELWPTDQRPFVADIMKIPPPSLTSKIVRITFKMSLLGLGGYIIYKYAPVPKGIRENVPLFLQNFINNVKLNSGLKYSLN